MVIVRDIHIFVCDDGHVHSELLLQDSDAPDLDEAAVVKKDFDTVEQALAQTLEFINDYNAKHR